MNIFEISYKQKTAIAEKFLKEIGLTDLTLENFGRKWSVNNVYSGRIHCIDLNPEICIELANYDDEPVLPKYRTKYLIGKNRVGELKCIERKLGKVKHDSNGQICIPYDYKDYTKEFKKVLNSKIIENDFQK